MRPRRFAGRPRPPPGLAFEKGLVALESCASLIPDSKYEAHHVNLQFLAFPAKQSAMHATLGSALENRLGVTIGDIERRNGLYILGKPRMGKSWLLVNLIRQDIENGHGVFFIDPHGDAIDDLLNRYTPRDPIEQYIVLDLEDRHYSFGINPLACQDLTDGKARADTFKKTKGIFDKLWKNTFEQSPWLQLVLQNTIYAFIENPGFTLAEFPLFFSSAAFRAFIVGNMRYNRVVYEYWTQTFATQSKRSQDEEMRAARTRAEIMLGHPYVLDVLGQTKTTIDFAKIIDNKEILLIKLSSGMAYESRKIIGTVVISELLHAVEQRPKEKRHQFCIFVDEFQTFAAYEDFSILITQAPKHGIATTLAHHERYGQLLEDPMILGATATIANKVLFQITMRDAFDFAYELADPPPTETRREERLAVSRSPVWDLLRGHANPKICEFVDKYVRPLKNRLEDLTGEIETDRLLRQDFMDESSLFRIESQLEGTHRVNADTERMRAALYEAGRAGMEAKKSTERMMEFREEITRLRESLRDFNSFLTAVMEGRADHGTETLSNFLLRRAREFSNLTPEELENLSLWIMLTFGRDDTPRVLSVRIAKFRNINEEEADRISKEMIEVYEEKKLEHKKSEFVNHYLAQLKKSELNLRFEHDPEKRRSIIYDANRYKRDIPMWLEQDMRMYDYFHGGDKLYEQIKNTLLPPIVLTQAEIKDVMVKCAFEMLRQKHTYSAFKVIVEFSEFCNLLREPENQIKVRTGQFIEAPANVRTIADMSNEMAQRLTELDKYSAYTKLLRARESWKGRIETQALSPLPVGEEEKARVGLCRNLITFHSWKAQKRRTEIEQEIRQRQERWRGRVVEEAPRTPSAVVNEPPPPTQSPPGGESNEPPPIHG